jgi:N-6 DNA methylase
MRPERKGKIELIDAPIPFKRLRKAISIKNEISPGNRRAVTKLYEIFAKNELSSYRMHLRADL